ncbi:MAG: hypothetical protein AAFR45_07175 [Pseudomonadota bacterium]
MGMIAASPYPSVIGLQSCSARARPVLAYLVEGCELETLNAFDFDAFNTKVITCEHDNTPIRKKIFDLFSRHGYQRKLEEFSAFDDWYVRQ